MALATTVQVPSSAASSPAARASADAEQLVGRRRVGTEGFELRPVEADKDLVSAACGLRPGGQTEGMGDATGFVGADAIIRSTPGRLDIGRVVHPAPAPAGVVTSARTRCRTWRSGASKVLRLRKAQVRFPKGVHRPAAPVPSLARHILLRGEGVVVFRAINSSHIPAG